MEKDRGHYHSAERKRSLNKDKRKQDLMKITMENQAILKRLQKTQSTYDVIKWEKQRLQHEKLMKKMSEYPINLYDGHHDHGRMTAYPGFRSKQDLPHLGRGSGSLTRKSKRRRFLNTQQDFFRGTQGLTGSERDAHTSSQKQSVQVYQDIGAMVNLDSQRKIFVKKTKMLSNGFYYVEISRTQDTFYIVAIKKRNSKENYLIELEWDKAKQILDQFNISDPEKDYPGDFNKLIDSLEILDNRLVLLNPKLKQQKAAKKRREKTRSTISHQKDRVFDAETGIPMEGDKPKPEEDHPVNNVSNQIDPKMSHN